MTTTLGKELLNRLVCAKYIFHRGVDILDRGGPFYSGLSVLNFQDSAEMVLRVIAEHLHCPLKENAPFNQILDAIDSRGDKKITHRIPLNQLNKARVNFKHFGLEPKDVDVMKFRKDLEAFFPIAISSFLDIHFESISLTSLIGHRRTENFLNEAERLIVEGKYEAVIRATAIAFTIFRSHYNTDRDDFWRDPFRRFKDHDLERWADNIEEAVAQQQSQLNLIMDGINLSDYRRFQRYTPVVHLTMAGTYEVLYTGHGDSADLSRDIALFCHRFAIEAILLMKNNQLPPRFPIQEPERQLRVIEKSAVIVWPCEDPEIIRYAEKGEILQGRSKKQDKPNYIAIIQDEDDAYIEKDAVVSVD